MPLTTAIGPGTQSGPLSGKYSSVNGLGSLGRWGITRDVPLESIVNSATGGGTSHNDQTRSWAGSYDAEGGQPLMLPGNAYAFAGYIAPRTGVKGAIGDLWSGQVKCTQAVITWDWENGTTIKHSVTFAGHGALTKAEGGAAITDATALVMQSPCGLPLTFGAFDVELLHRKKAVLTLTVGSSPVRNSSTACETKTETGALNWTLVIDVDGAGQALAEGAILGALKIYTQMTGDPLEPSHPWVLNYAKVGATTGLEVEPGKVKVVGQSINLAMQANHPDTGALGSILLPDGTTYWPEA